MSYVVVADYAYPGQESKLSIDMGPYHTRYEAKKDADEVVELFRGYYSYMIIKEHGRTYRALEREYGEDFHIPPEMP